MDNEYGKSKKSLLETKRQRVKNTPKASRSCIVVFVLFLAVFGFSMYALVGDKITPTKIIKPVIQTGRVLSVEAIEGEDRYISAKYDISHTAQLFDWKYNTSKNKDIKTNEYLRSGAMYYPGFTKEVSVEVDVRIPSGKEAEIWLFYLKGFGGYRFIISREVIVENSNNEYVVSIGGIDKIDPVQGATRIKTGTFSKFKRWTWVRVRIEIRGATISAYVNDKLVCEVEDMQFRSGRVRFRSPKGNANFDNIRISGTLDSNWFQKRCEMNEVLGWPEKSPVRSTVILKANNDEVLNAMKLWWKKRKWNNQINDFAKMAVLALCEEAEKRGVYEVSITEKGISFGKEVWACSNSVRATLVDAAIKLTGISDVRDDLSYDGGAVLDSETMALLTSKWDKHILIVKTLTSENGAVMTLKLSKKIEELE